jgi:hypothetical protein
MKQEEWQAEEDRMNERSNTRLVEEDIREDRERRIC